RQFSRPSVGENDDPFSETRTTSPSKAHHRHQHQHPHPHPDRQSVEETPHSALKFLSSLPSLASSSSSSSERDASAAPTTQPPPQLGETTPRSQLLRDISNLSSHSIEAVEADTSAESVWPAKQHVSNADFFKRLSSQKNPVDNSLANLSSIASTSVSTSAPHENTSLSLALSFADSDLFAQPEPSVFASPTFMAASHHPLSQSVEESSRASEKQPVSLFADIPKAPYSFNPPAQQEKQVQQFGSGIAFSFQSANSNLSATSPSPFDPSPPASLSSSIIFSPTRATESAATSLPAPQSAFQLQASLSSTAPTLFSKIPLPKTKVPAPRFKLDLGPDGGFTPIGGKPVLCLASLPGPSRLSALAGQPSHDDNNDKHEASDNADHDASVDDVLDFSATPCGEEDLFLVDIPSAAHSFGVDEHEAESEGVSMNIPIALHELPTEDDSAEMPPASALSFLVSVAPAAESGADMHRYETIDADLTAPRLDLSFAMAVGAGEVTAGMHSRATATVKGSFHSEKKDEAGQQEEEVEGTLDEEQMSVSEILVSKDLLDVDELGETEGCEYNALDGFSVETTSAAAGTSGRKSGGQEQEQHRQGSEAVVRGSLGPGAAGKATAAKETARGRHNNESEDEEDRKRRGNTHADADHTGHRASVPFQQQQHSDARMEHEEILFEDKLVRDARLAGVNRLVKAVQDGTGEGVLIPVGPETLEEVQDRLLFEFRLGISKIRGSIERDRMDEQSYHDRITAKKKELEKLEKDVANLNKVFFNLQQDLAKAQNELVHERATLQQTQFENRELIELAKTRKLLKLDSVLHAPNLNHKELSVSWPKYLGVVVRWIFKWILRLVTTLASCYLLYCWVAWMITSSRDLQYNVYRKSRLSGPSLDMTVFRILDVLNEFVFGFKSDAEGTSTLL
ncbi:hypothetical protein BC830DRAFT_1135343, partial [Chytriomyces sp. MP71]